jgi:uncharacterized protein (TIGR02270 family)
MSTPAQPAEGTRLARPPNPVVVTQHVEEAAHLRHVRSVLVRAPHVALLHLGRLDERLAAQLDGVAEAGEYGNLLCRQALERPGSGEVFAAAVGAILDGDVTRLDAPVDISRTLPECRPGLLSAFGWVSATDLRGVTRMLLGSEDPWRREVGLATCAMHGVDARAALDAALADANPALRARALSVAGRTGRVDLRSACVAALFDEDVACAFEAAQAALMLGDRSASVTSLEALALTPGIFNARALSLLLKVLTPEHAKAVLAQLTIAPEATRTLVRGVGIAGDPHHVPWLIARTEDPALTRLAGEAFSLITGLDLAHLDLDRNPPEDVDHGPNDDPEDTNVAMDEDDSLPWPDAAKCAAWWRAHGSRFNKGTRYFMGEPPSPAQALAVLNTGFQRQRAHAAQYRCLLGPGTPLFNVAAPTWRQQRMLSQLSGRQANG